MTLKCHYATVVSLPQFEQEPQMQTTRSRRIGIPAVLLVLSACAGDRATEPGQISSPAVASNSVQTDAAPMAWRGTQRKTLTEAVETWNDNVTAFGALAGVAPPVEARMYAMGNLAIHDVMNAVDRRFDGYAYTGSVDRPVSVEAALATATHGVLAAVGGALPTTDALQFIDQAHSDYMAQVGSGDAIDRGVELGEAVAASILASRAGDGAAGPPVTFFSSTGNPGNYRPTLAPSTDGLSGLQAVSHWGNVRPFVLTSTDQFRPGPMYGAATVEEAVNTPAYLADYAEVKRLGGMVSERTQEQTDIGIFWIESSAEGWNRIARAIAATRHMDAWNLAHMMAQVSLAIADGYISVFEAKYHYNFWRPVTAIRLGNLDLATPGDPTWDVASMSVGLGPTPPIPEYSSAHAVAASAAAEAIRANVGGPVQFKVESPTLPGKPRSFRSLEAAERENADSRIYIGFHFRQATVIGMEQGKQVGQYITSHALRRVRGE
jgi:nucleotide-binding universal stress UspA family protein